MGGAASGGGNLSRRAGHRLQPVLLRLPVIAYNLSCYACRMQQLDLARHWFHRSVAAGHKEALQQMALADEDLQPLWAEIQNL